MPDNPILSDRLEMVLNTALEENLRTIERMPLDETISPKLMLFREGQVQRTIVFGVITDAVDENNQEIEFARKRIPEYKGDFENYVLGYCIQSAALNGEKHQELVLQVGEQPSSFKHIFSLPFKRDTEGKVIRLSDKPIFRRTAPSAEG